MSKVNRLRPELISQPDNCGCVPACVAMILGVPYDAATKMFAADFQADGVTHDAGVDAVLGHGWVAVTKKVDAYNHKDDHREFLLTPFADIHLLTVVTHADCSTGHAVVMLEDGTILDPSEKPLKKEDYWYIRTSTGFWKK